jgi:hypothetical protein
MVDAASPYKCSRIMAILIKTTRSFSDRSFVADNGSVYRWKLKWHVITASNIVSNASGFPG